MSESKSEFNLPVEAVEKDFREPFISTGYRKPRMSGSNCLKSIFQPSCNECFNVWSHFLYGIYFCVKYWRVFTTEIDITDPFVWPLLTLALGMIMFCFMSATAHTFNSMSPYVRHKCFYLDYAAISVYGLGADLAFFFYTRPLDTESIWFKSQCLFIGISLVNSLVSTYLCCMSRTQWTRFRYLIRTCSFANTFLIASTTVIYRYLFCSSEFDCDTRNFPGYWLHAMFLLIAAIFNVSKLPERFFARTFDCFGSSHNLMHIFTCVGTEYKFEFIKSELIDRKARLLTDDIKANTFTGLILMMGALVLNFLICHLVEPSQNKTEDTQKDE